MHDSDEFTQLLRASRDDDQAASRLFDRVYDELRGIARNQLRRERAGHFDLGGSAVRLFELP